MFPAARRFVATITLAVALAVPAAANDSSAELAAGGLVLVKTDSITMQREDLTLSPSQVHVRYEMRNDTGSPVTLRVAFPMPEVPKDTPGGMDTSTGHNIEMMPPVDANFIGFHVWVNGQEVEPETEIRAKLPDGRDVTNTVRQIGGLPLVLYPRFFVLPTDPSKRTGPNGGWDLDAAARRRLQDAGALELEQDGQAYQTLWTTWITFHWMQTFPRGVTVVEHNYRPIVGGQLLGATRPDDIGVADAEAGTWNGSLDMNLAATYCIDGPTDRELRSLYKGMLHARMAAGIHNDAYFPAFVLGYILRTAQNWHGPIETFHLVLLGDPLPLRAGDARKTRVISLCTDLPLRQTAPMRFEATVHDYVPSQDLRVLLVPGGQ